MQRLSIDTLGNVKNCNGEIIKVTPISTPIIMGEYKRDISESFALKNVPEQKNTDPTINGFTVSENNCMTSDCRYNFAVQYYHVH